MPVHTVYGGAHLFQANLAAKLGRQALKIMSMEEAGFGEVFGLPQTLLHTVYTRVLAKLHREPVEDFRIDFEDGFGYRSDAEEDSEAIRSSKEIVRGIESSSLPPWVGIRIKPFTETSRSRAIRTLELFLREMNGRLPQGFVVTLPKVSSPGQVSGLVEQFERLESELSLTPGSLTMELMIETPQSIVDGEGRIAIPHLLRAANGRCRGLHFGAYDYTSSCGITAAHQDLDHPTCDFARNIMQIAAAGRDIALSDGATSVLPTGNDPAAVSSALRLHFDRIQRSLRHGFYQGWDLHPAQLPARFAAVYVFFLQGFEAAANRLKSFIQNSAQATLSSNVFDDAATGRGLVNYFLRGYDCGAITEQEALASGLSLDELRTLVHTGRTQSKT